jgi:acetolactate synthase-1/2/3 large subunit
MNELATMHQHGVPLKLVVMNNRTLGLVREIQRDGFGGNEFAVDLDGGPDIGMIAAAYGLRHERIARDEESPAAIGRLLADGESYLLELDIDPKEATS